MSQLEKLLERIKNNPKTVRFNELDKILQNAGFAVRQPRGGSSHYTYTKGKIILTIPRHNPYIKQLYVEKAIECLMKDGEY